MDYDSIVKVVDNLWGKGVEPRKESAKYLNSVNAGEVLPILRQLLASDNLERRLSAAEAMLMVDRERNAEEVLFLLDSPESWVRRHMCGFFLDYGYGNLKVQNKIIRIAESDPDSDVRAMACETLGWIGTDQCIETLRLIALKDQEKDSKGESVRNYAINALATLANRYSMAQS